ncbi:MAG: hypothetical protein AAF797_09085 [Planctomycetota bacterium]
MSHNPLTPTPAPSLDDLYDAFPIRTPFPAAIDGTPPEIISIAQTLGRRPWTEVPTKWCSANSDALAMLDLEPLAFYFPAFLAVTIDQPNSVAAESLVYNVISKPFRPLLDRLSSEQRDLAFGTVAWALSQTNDFASGEDAALLKQVQHYAESH